MTQVYIVIRYDDDQEKRIIAVFADLDTAYDYSSAYNESGDPEWYDVEVHDVIKAVNTTIKEE
jgi:hypothetical protein